MDGISQKVGRQVVLINHGCSKLWVNYVGAIIATGYTQAKYEPQFVNFHSSSWPGFFVLFQLAY